jgi:hypothetical protein
MIINQNLTSKAQEAWHRPQGSRTSNLTVEGILHWMYFSIAESARGTSMRECALSRMVKHLSMSFSEHLRTKPTVSSVRDSSDPEVSMI